MGFLDVVDFDGMKREEILDGYFRITETRLM